MGFNFQVGARPVFAGVPGLAPTTPPRPVAAIRRGERLPAAPPEAKREQARAYTAAPPRRPRIEAKPVRTPADVEVGVSKLLAQIQAEREAVTIAREALEAERLAALDAISRERGALIRERKAVERKLGGVPSDGVFKIWDVIRLVSIVSGESIAALKGPQRGDGITKVRFVLFWLAKRFCQRSLPEIGRDVGGKDHTTALYGIRRVDLLVEQVGAPADDSPAAWAKHLLAVPGKEWPRYTKHKH